MSLEKKGSKLGQAVIGTFMIAWGGFLISDAVANCVIGEKATRFLYGKVTGWY